MKKRFWVGAEPYDPALITAAIEAGAEAVVVPPGKHAEVERLGRITTVSEDGDLQWGRDVARVRIRSQADEEQVDGRLPTVIENDDWTIIPLENLISRAAGNLIQTVHDAREAELALQVMERGADGILLRTTDPAVVRETAAVVERANREDIPLTPVRIVETRPVTLSDRCCIDTTSLLPPGVGLLVGDTASAFFLIYNENVETPYCNPRPFRVNAGAVHAYVRLPGNRTSYLAELSTGDEVLAVDPKGCGRIVAVGRNKIERRPMLRVVAEDDEGRQVSLILQNAETVRLTTPEGDPASVTALQSGDQVLAAFFQPTGRHFGRAIEERILEK
ncbi:MAG: 3-dehydroquinate synthase II [Methylohalobius sp. ZOD2]